MFYIYRLTDEEQDYYGQTEDPTKRLVNHKSQSETSRSKLLDRNKMNMHIIHTLYTKQEADETEEFYQLNFPCVNYKITGRTKQEYMTAYYQEHKEEIAEQRNKKHDCECGGRYTHSNKDTHIKTKKHKDYLNQLNKKK
tara:strand:+ start:209 stop:625 length:417 start_codon:yes stop_codon:yes gene_type:complete